MTFSWVDWGCAASENSHAAYEEPMMVGSCSKVAAAEHYNLFFNQQTHVRLVVQS